MLTNIWLPFINQDAVDSDKAPNSEKNLKSRAILARQGNGIVPEQVNFVLVPKVPVDPQFFFKSDSFFLSLAKRVLGLLQN